MERFKHSIAVGDRGRQYLAPKSRAIFVKTQGMLCQSPDNEPMSESDCGDGGFGNDF